MTGSLQGRLSAAGRIKWGAPGAAGIGVAASAGAASAGAAAAGVGATTGTAAAAAAAGAFLVERLRGINRKRLQLTFHVQRTIKECILQAWVSGVWE